MLFVVVVRRVLCACRPAVAGLRTVLRTAIVDATVGGRSQRRRMLLRCFTSAFVRLSSWSLPEASNHREGTGDVDPPPRDRPAQLAWAGQSSQAPIRHLGLSKPPPSRSPVRVR